MKRFLCLDIGDKRIGVAVSDPFNTYALPVETYHRKNLRTDLAKIAEYVKAKGATDVVCGLPVNFDGTPSLQTRKAEFFIDRLKETVAAQVIAVDERCSTCEAEEVLIEQGKSRSERKQFVDALAACEILQGFLNEKNSSVRKGDKFMSDKEKQTCGCGCEHEHHHDHEQEHTHCDHDACDCEDCCDDGCDCGCEDDIVVLTGDDGKKMKFYFVGTIEYKGKTYSAFEPAEEIDGIEEDDLIIFELSGDDEETAELLPVDDEALLDEVFNEFCRVMEEDELAEEAESLEPDGE
mgnify:FL=1